VVERPKGVGGAIGVKSGSERAFVREALDDRALVGVKLGLQAFRRVRRPRRRSAAACERCGVRRSRMGAARRLVEERGAKVTRRLLAAAAPQSGERLLELASGAGDVGLAAAPIVARETWSSPTLRPR
jgi:hypothetical protein